MKCRTPPAPLQVLSKGELLVPFSLLKPSMTPSPIKAGEDVEPVRNGENREDRTRKGPGHSWVWEVWETPEGSWARE